MAIDESAAVGPVFATLSGTTLAGTWTLVTVPAWARWAEVINDTGSDVQIRAPSVADTTAYLATDPQVTVATGGTQVVSFAASRDAPPAFTFSVRTAVAQTLRFVVGA